MRLRGCARRARAGAGRLPQYKEQEVSNTLLAFAKAEHVDFALMEARPLPRTPGLRPARRGALHVRRARRRARRAVERAARRGMARAALLNPSLLHRVPHIIFCLGGCIQAAPLQLMRSVGCQAGRARACT